MLNLKSAMTVTAISEFADNTIFIHFESRCLVTLEVTAIPEFSLCLVLGCWKSIIDFTFAGRILQSGIPLTIIGCGPPLELIDSIASIVVFIGYTIITALLLLSRICRNTCSPCHRSPLAGGSRCLQLPGVLTRSPSCEATQHGLNNSLTLLEKGKSTFAIISCHFA